jgi:hypothetical protein
MITESKKLNDLDSKLNLAINSLTLENREDVLDTIFKDISIKVYYDTLLVLHPYLNKNTIFKSSIKNCLLAYEGSCYTNLSYLDKQWILLYFLLRDLPNCSDLFLEIHKKVKENKRLSEEFISDFLKGLKNKNPKAKTDRNSVINDVLSMYLYYSDFRHPSISFQIEKHKATMTCVDLNISIDYVFKNLHITAWKTKWGKLKAFNRNWPEIIKNRKQEMIAYYF